MSRGETLTSQIEISASDDTRKALAELGRTEDVKFSPDNRRLALAGYAKNEILIVNVFIDESATGKRVILSDCMTVTAKSLKGPHGLAFIDDETLIVANRDGDAPILKLPPLGAGERSFELFPLQTLRADQVHLLKSPGSVTSSRIGLDLYQVLICNNYLHNVTRHILDARDGFRPLRNEVLLSKGLDIPDGVAINGDSSWIAVSNHTTHSVLMFKNGPGLGLYTRPDGVLRNVDCPHGVCFTTDDNFVVAAGAGEPFFHIYAKNGADWNGARDPVASIRAIDEETFLRGRHNPQEGGPKGLDITNDMRVSVTTCDHQVLAFFDLEKILKEQAADRKIALAVSADRTPSEVAGSVQNRSAPVAISGVPELLRDAGLTREALVRELLKSGNINTRMAWKKAVLDAVYILFVYRSRTWRITAWLRQAYYSVSRVMKRKQR